MGRKWRLRALALPLALALSCAFLGSQTPRRLVLRRAESEDEDRAPALDCILPIGPFSPFRSSACDFNSDLGKGMTELTSESPSFAVEMSRMQLDMQMGQQVDPTRMNDLAEKLDASFQRWDGLMARLRFSDDFQSREYYKLTTSHMGGTSIEDMGRMVRYQVDCMRAVARGLNPPMPPPDLNLAVPENMPSATGAPPVIEAEPFDSLAFKSDMVKEEYELLRRDHRQLIKMGESYGSFDPLGKIAFLDQLERIEERWDIFFGRLGLIGALSPEYKEQSAAFLQAMGLSPGEFRRLLRRAHDQMRLDAEDERSQR